MILKPAGPAAEVAATSASTRPNPHRDEHRMASWIMPAAPACLLVRTGTWAALAVGSAGGGRMWSFPGEHGGGFAFEVDVGLAADVDRDPLDGAAGGPVWVFARIVARDGAAARLSRCMRR